MKRHYPHLCFIACLLLALLVYWPGANGYFQFDDTINIVESPRIKINSLDFQVLRKAAISGDAGILGRPISVLSFALNYYFSQLDPFYFKWTNIVIHLLNGACVYILSHLLLISYSRLRPPPLNNSLYQWISVAVGAAWVLHPINVSGALYIVQRMTSLASLFMFLGLIFYIQGRLRHLNHQSGWLHISASFIIFTPLAAFSKENGALLPVFLLLTELVFFRFQSTSKKAKNWLLATFLITVIIPAALGIIYSLYSPGWILRGYSVRDFSLYERCLTETRVIWFYIRLLIAPSISQFGLYHDDIAISKGLLVPADTIIAAGSLLAICAFAAISLRRYPIAAFGILFFLLGHSVESSILPLEIAHEHRNYFPSFGLLFVLFYYLLSASDKLLNAKLRIGIAALFILIFGAVTFSRTMEWGNPAVLKEKEVLRHPNSVRANIEMGYFYAYLKANSQSEWDDYYRKAYGHFAAAASASPTDTLGLFGLIMLNLERSIPIEESWVSVLATRIEKSPFAPSTGNSIGALKNCYIEKKCQPDPDVVEKFIQAALKNPTLSGKTKIQMLLAQAEFLFDSKHQQKEAAAFAQQAADIAPADMDTQVKVITFLINIHKPDEAILAITAARKLDKFSTYTNVFNNLENTIKILKDPYVQ